MKKKKKKKVNTEPCLIITCECSQTIKLNAWNFRMHHPSGDVRAMDWNEVDEK